MSNIDKQALRQTAEKAQEHGVFNMDVHSQTVLALLDELEAAEKLIAELELKLEAADKLQDSAFRHGLQHGFSYGQTDNQAGFEQAIQAYGQQWKGE